MVKSTGSFSFLLVIVLCVGQNAYGQLGTPTDLSIKSRSSIANSNEQIDSLSRALMTAVFDTSFNTDERCEFVILLGEIGTEPCIDFLINNLNYRMPVDMMGETGLAQDMIFLVVLTEKVKNKWSIIESIRKAVQNGVDFDKKMLTRLSIVLVSSCNNNFEAAVTILKDAYNGTSSKKKIDEMLLLISGG